MKRAVPAIQGMRALIREWDTEYLLELMKSPKRRTADAACGVFLCMPQEEMDQSILRQHFMDYKERAGEGCAWRERMWVKECRWYEGMQVGI